MVIKYPPGPKSLSPLGHLFEFAQNPLAFLVDVAAEYGDIAHFKIRKRDVFLLVHPEDVQELLVSRQRQFVKNPGFQTIKKILGEGLLSSEGDFHLRQRRMIQPIFHKHKVANYGEIMLERLVNFEKRWKDGSQVSMDQEMARLTLEIVGKALFGAEVGGRADQISTALNDAMSLFHHITSPASLIRDRIPFLRDRRFERGKERLDREIIEIIRSYRNEENDSGSLLSLLIESRDEEDPQARMTDEQIRDEALTLLLAGHETTAVALTWTWYILSQHPQVEAELLEELHRVLAGRQPDVDDIPRLTYAAQVLDETLRLYPPVYMLGRQTLEDFPVRGYTIPAGSSVIVSPFITQNDARFFPEPERFNPQRWAPENRSRLPKFAFFPFGGGQRVCIGEPFARQECILVLAALTQNWSARIVPGYHVDVLPRVTLRPKGGLPMILKRR